MSVPKNGQFTFYVHEHSSHAFFLRGEPAQGSEEQKNVEHLPPALDNKVFYVSYIVENAVPVSRIFPKSSKPEFNIRIGPVFARRFEVGARTNARYNGRPCRSPAQK